MARRDDSAVGRAAPVRARFSADPADVLALAADPARWREWAGPIPIWWVHRHLGRVTVRARPDGGGELEWSLPARPTAGLPRPVLRAILSLLARRLVTEADRRIAVTRRPSLPARFQRPDPLLVEGRDGQDGPDDQLQADALEPCRQAGPTGDGDPPVGLGDEPPREQ